MPTRSWRLGRQVEILVADASIDQSTAASAMMRPYAARVLREAEMLRDFVGRRTIQKAYPGLVAQRGTQLEVSGWPFVAGSVGSPQGSSLGTAATAATRSEPGAGGLRESLTRRRISGRCAG